VEVSVRGEGASDFLKGNIIAKLHNGIVFITCRLRGSVCFSFLGHQERGQRGK